MNRHLLHTMNGWAGRSWPLDNLMIFCASWLIYLVFVVAAVCSLLLFRRRHWRPLGYFSATLVVSFVLLRLSGHIYSDERPFMTQHVHRLVQRAAGKAFPSDHTTAAAAIAFGLVAFTPFRKAGSLMLLAACLIGFAPIYVGIHWPIDIAGALLTSLVGTTLVGAAFLIDRRWTQPSGTIQAQRAHV